MLQPAPPQLPLDLSLTPLMWVDSPQSLATMVEQITGENLLAVDLEAHSYRWVPVVHSGVVVMLVVVPTLLGLYLQEPRLWKERLGRRPVDAFRGKALSWNVLRHEDGLGR